LPREWQKDLKEYSDKVGIEFMSTPFDEKAVEELVDLGVKRLKISGFESTDFRFVEMVASSKLPLIISIGIGFPTNYIGKILDIVEKYENDLSLLHCQNAYPTPVSEIDLGVIQTLKHFKNVSKVGLSDHTTSVNVPAFAVCAGADIIEKHYTISKNLDGPDHKFALEPFELSKMVNLIKEAEQAMIKNTYDLYANCEKQFISARRSVVSTRKILKGEILTKENTTTKRPYLEGYIAAIDYHSVLGASVNKNIEEDTAIKITDL
jgi:sialic acid synthase SpsE